MVPLIAGRRGERPKGPRPLPHHFTLLERSRREIEERSAGSRRDGESGVYT